MSGELLCLHVDWSYPVEAEKWVAQERGGQNCRSEVLEGFGGDGIQFTREELVLGRSRGIHSFIGTGGKVKVSGSSCRQLGRFGGGNFSKFSYH